MAEGHQVVEREWDQVKGDAQPGVQQKRRAAVLLGTRRAARACARLTPFHWVSERRSMLRITEGFALVLLTALALCGCGMVQDMAESQKKSDAIAVSLEKELGIKPLVGWNINNGTLTYVNVTFPLDGVSKLAVGELEAKVRAIVLNSFEKPPEQLVV